MSAYQIIDEPKPSLYHTLVVDPIIILFAALLVPIFIELLAIAGCVTLVALYCGTLYISTVDLTMARFLYPYYQIIIQGALFFTLYVIVFYQSPPYAIHQYIRSSNQV